MIARHSNKLVRLPDDTPEGADPVRYHVVLIKRGDGTWLGVEPIHGITALGDTEDEAAVVIANQLLARWSSAPGQRTLYAQASAALGKKPTIDHLTAVVSGGTGG